MTLDDYLSSGSMTVARLATLIGCSDAQVRQWRIPTDPTKKRRYPGAAYAAKIERATNGAVMRWDLRPHDWHEIWTSLRRRKDAPSVMLEAA